MARAAALWVVSILPLQALCFIANAKDTRVTVSIVVHQKVQYGQEIKVVGNADELYNWNSLTWNADNEWSTVLELIKGKTYECKAVVVHYSTNACCC